MANLNVRYGGQTVALDNGFNFNPQSFGTYRLNAKINSAQTFKFGLTTNTNAKDYCKFAMRVNGQILYIGRVSTVSYVSGQPVDYNGSSVGSSSTSLYTEGGVRNTGSGTGTSAANPTIRTITNATGSSVTTATASAKIASQTYYSMSLSSTSNQKSTSIMKTTNTVTASKASIYTNYTTSFRTSSIAYTTTNYNQIKAIYDIENATSIWGLSQGNSSVITAMDNQTYFFYTTYSKSISQVTNSTINSSTEHFKYSSTGPQKLYTSSKTIIYTNSTSTSTKQYITEIKNAGKTVTISKPTILKGRPMVVYNAKTITLTLSSTVKVTKNLSSSVYSYASTSKEVKNVTSSYYHMTHITNATTKHFIQPIQTYYSYSTRYSYTWTSQEKYTKSSTHITETVHNMNL